MEEDCWNPSAETLEAQSPSPTILEYEVEKIDHSFAPLVVSEHFHGCYPGLSHLAQRISTAFRRVRIMPSQGGKGTDPKAKPSQTDLQRSVRKLEDELSQYQHNPPNRLRIVAELSYALEKYAFAMKDARSLDRAIMLRCQTQSIKTIITELSVDLTNRYTHLPFEGFDGGRESSRAEALSSHFDQCFGILALVLRKRAVLDLAILIVQPMWRYASYNQDFIMEVFLRTRQLCIFLQCRADDNDPECVVDMIVHLLDLFSSTDPERYGTKLSTEELLAIQTSVLRLINSELTRIAISTWKTQRESHVVLILRELRRVALSHLHNACLSLWHRPNELVHHLGKAYHARFEAHQRLTDLDSAIRLLEAFQFESKEESWDVHPLLICCYRRRYELLHDERDLARAAARRCRCVNSLECNCAGMLKLLRAAHTGDSVPARCFSETHVDHGWVCDLCAQVLDKYSIPPLSRIPWQN